MRKILAVSGGVDSMVMLDLMTKTERFNSSGDMLSEDEYSSGDIIVAHFDHGIRDNSGVDADFVRKMTEEIYHETYISKNGLLEKAASEEEAREARYEFLRETARKNTPATIYTAHHLDDLIETVAINLIRGTGWRGLAVLDTDDIKRPLLEAEICYEPMDKMAIFEYAAKRGLRFREDQTNSSEKYLRNRVREGLTEEAWDYERKLEMWELWKKQKELKREIERLVAEMVPKEGEAWPRKWFWEMEEEAKSLERQDVEEGLGARSDPSKAESMRVASRELLRAGLLQAGVRTTRPQLEEFRQAVLTYKSGKYFNLPGDRLVKISKEEFWLDF